MRSVGTAFALAASLSLASCSHDGGSAFTPSGAPLPGGMQRLHPNDATASFAVFEATGGPVQSVFVSIDGNAQTATQNIAKGTPGCNTSSQGIVCTVTFASALTFGQHTYDFWTYPQPNAKGTALSRNRGFPLTVGASATSLRVPIAIGTQATKIVITALPNQSMHGSQTAGFALYGFYKADGVTRYVRKFTVFGRDANGRMVLGPGAPSVSLSSGNTSVWSNGVAAGTNPNLFSVTPQGAYSGLSSVQFTAVADLLNAHFPLRLFARNAPRIYVGGFSTPAMAVFDEFGNPVTVSGSFPNVNSATAILFAGSRLFVTSGNSIAVFDTEGNPVTMPAGAFSTGGLTPIGIAYDAAHDHIVVGAYRNGSNTGGAPPWTFTRAGALVSTAGNWSVPPGLYPSYEFGIVADSSSGKVYVTAYSQSTGAAPAGIYVYDSQGNYQSTIDPYSFSAFPSNAGALSMIQDQLSHHFVFTDNSQGIWTMDASGNQLAPQPCQCNTPGSAFSMPPNTTPQGIAQDPATGWLYFASVDYNRVDAYDTAGNAIALSASQNWFAPGGVTNPDAVAIVP